MSTRTLRISKKEAREQLAAQIEKFVELEGRRIENREELERYKRDRLRYTKVNILMLDRMFDKDYDKFWRYELASPGYNPDFETQIEFYKDQDGKQLTELHALHDGLDYMTESISKTQNSPATPNKTKDKKWSRSDKLALVGLVITLVGVIAAWLTVPEFRSVVYQLTSRLRATPTTNESADAAPTPEKTILERDFELADELGRPNFVFHVIANGQDDSIKIEVYDKPSGRRIQTIVTDLHVSGLPYFGLSDAFLVVEDMNFDGVEDFRILSSYGGAGQEHIGYLFRSNFNKFEFDKNLSDIMSWSGGLTFDRKRKELQRYSSCGGALYGITRVYRLEAMEGFVLDRTYVLEDGKDLLVDNETTCDSYYR